MQNLLCNTISHQYTLKKIHTKMLRLMKTTFHCQTLMQKQRNKNNMYRYIKLSVLSALVFNSSVQAEKSFKYLLN